MYQYYYYYFLFGVQNFGPQKELLIIIFKTIFADT
jgi:hypothetical protein